MNKYKLMFILCVIALVAVVFGLLFVPVKSVDEPAEQIFISLDDVRLDSAIAVSALDKPAAEPVTYEDWFRINANVIFDCEITHYCAEKREHICGTGDGITATGVPVTHYWTCAVDPSVIPYGSEVMVDYGDSVAFYKAQDCGGAIKGNHIDLAVETHLEAMEAGRTTAAVYWLTSQEVT